MRANLRRYFNRELSWLEFNSRVLEEAMDEGNPLLERVKFLSIFYTNLDEFFMVRVSGLIEQADSGIGMQSPDGLSPREQLVLVRARVLNLLAQAEKLFAERLRPQLARAGIYLYDLSRIKKPQRKALQDYFTSTVYPVLTPLAVDPAHPFPHISNLSLSLAVVIRDRDKVERFARVKIPDVLPRLVPIDAPGGKDAGVITRSRRHAFVWMEQLVAANLGSLFKGMKVQASYPFRVLRDADLEIRFDEAEDLIRSIEQSLAQRRFGSVSQLTVSDDMPADIRSLLVRNLEISETDLYPAGGALGLGALLDLCDLDLPHLKDRPLRQRIHPALKKDTDYFASIRAQDILLHHPYDSFAPVIDLVKAAAADPTVLAIKMTIYRVGANSPIVAALAEAANNGKQVSVIVELKARFDEENNIVWSRALENAGAHVVYGTIDLKTHCKVLLIVRRERDGIKRYVHLGTGNYNSRTSRTYTDLSLLTCDPDIAEDVSALLNVLTGYGINSGYRKLLVSPGGIRQGLFRRIEREIDHARAGMGGRIIMKMNSLTDFASADALYRASNEGVNVDLIVRGSCCLVPGVPGLSENIRVISIVGRFLEHHRIYYFRNGGHGDEEVWLGSADMMQRNLDGRVETLFPVEDVNLKNWLIQSALLPHLTDNAKARELQSDGSYLRLQPAAGEEPFSVQSWLQANSEQESAMELAELPRPVRKTGRAKRVDR